MQRNGGSSRLIIAIALAGCVGLPGCGDEAEPPEERTTDRSEPAVDSSRVGRDEIEAALSAADQYLNAGQLPKAEAILARLIEKAPREARARELMGQVLTLRARSPGRDLDPAEAAELRREAYEHYRMAAELQPNTAGLQQSAGVMAMAAERLDAAVNHFDRAAELDPLRPQHPLFAAQALIQLQRYDEARRRLETVLTLDPDEPLAHASLAVVAMERRRYADALTHIGEARAIAPDDLRFRVQEARIHRRGGDPARSIELLAGLPVATRTEESVTSELAAAHSAMGDHVQAAEAWAIRYRLRPTEPTAYLAAVRAGEAMLAADRWAEAEIWLDQARAAGGQAPEVLELAEALAGRSSPSNGG